MNIFITLFVYFLFIFTFIEALYFVDVQKISLFSTLYKHSD